MHTGPLTDRIRLALRDTCKLHSAHGDCERCDQRFAAIMEAVKPEVELLKTYDDRLFFVLEQRVAESKRAIRYRNAWLSARKGRRGWRKAFEAEANVHANTWDRLERHRENAEMNARDFRSALKAAERLKEVRDLMAAQITGYDNELHRYRNAWLSARQGRAAWRSLYLWAMNGPNDRQDLRFLNLARKHAKTIKRLTEEKKTLEVKLDGVSRVRADLRATLEVLGDDHVTAWKRVRELEADNDLLTSKLSLFQTSREEWATESARQAHEIAGLRAELDDYRLAASEAEGAKSRETAAIDEREARSMEIVINSIAAEKCDICDVRRDQHDREGILHNFQ